MPRCSTGRPRGRPRTRGRTKPLEPVTDRRRRNSRSVEEIQFRLQKDREAQRNRRQDRFNAQRQQLVQENFVSSTYLLHLHQNISARRQLYKLPKTYCSACLFPKDNEMQTHSVDDMDKKCVHCSAKLFAEEFSDNSATVSCHNGKVKLEPVKVCEELQNLTEQNDDFTKNYLENIRQFNNAQAFASVQENMVNITDRGPYCFKLHGQVYDEVGSLQPPAEYIEKKIMPVMTENRHLRKKIPCKVCGKLFCYDNLLNIHEAFHKGFKLYHCQCCSLSFYNSYALHSHLRHHSSIQSGDIPCCESNCFKLENVFQFPKVTVKVSAMKKIKITVNEPHLKKIEKNEKFLNHANQLLFQEKKNDNEKTLRYSNCEKFYSFNSGLLEGEAGHCSRVSSKHSDKGSSIINIARNVNKSEVTNISVPSKNFFKLSDLKKHVDIPVPAKKCNNNVSNTSAIKSIHLEEKPSERQISRNKLFQSSDLTVQSQIREEKKSFECTICNKKFCHSETFRTDTRLNIDEKLFICDVCKKKFPYSSSLKNHSRIHTGERLFECDICNKKFRQSSRLKAHSRIHIDEKQFVCDICNKKFSQLRYLKVHYRIHTGEKPFTCSICNKKFTQIGTLNQHFRIHTGEKPFACSICNKKFTRVGCLKRHFQTHSGEKPFECNICKKRFANSSSFKVHSRIHTEKKPSECDICNEKFMSKGDLKRHSRFHTGENPLERDMFNIKFHVASNLKTYSRIHMVENSNKIFA